MRTWNRSRLEPPSTLKSSLVDVLILLTVCSVIGYGLLGWTRIGNAIKAGVGPPIPAEERP